MRAEQLDLTLTTRGTGSADLRIQNSEVAQTATELPMFGVVLQHDARRGDRSTPCRTISITHLAFEPAIVDRQKNRRLVGEVPIERLRRITGAPRDTIRIGSVEPNTIELGARRYDQSFTAGATRTRRPSHVGLPLLRCCLTHALTLYRNQSDMSITSDNSRSRLDAVGVWDPVERYNVDGVQLAIARRGRGPRVVCLHATGHGGRDFESFAERVGDTFEVIAVDWPGQGRSPRETAPASAWRYAELIERFVPQLGGEPVIVIGCSIGGAAAIELAARRPDLVRALVLCNPGGLAPINKFARFAIRRLQSFFAAGARGTSWYPFAFNLYYRMVLPQAAARPQRQRIVAAARDVAPILTQAWASFADSRSDLRSLAAQVGCPTLFAWAKKDRILPWSQSRQGAERFPHMSVRFFDAGHAAFLEDPDAFAREFRSFVAGVLAPTALEPNGTPRRAKLPSLSA